MISVSINWPIELQSEETFATDMTRAVINGLPRLFAKHQTDNNRIADVLIIPQLMNLDMYLEMRMIPVRVYFFSIFKAHSPDALGV